MKGNSPEVWEAVLSMVKVKEHVEADVWVACLGIQPVVPSFYIIIGS